MQTAYDVVRDVWWDRVLPLVIARAAQSVQHPLEWGVLELVVLELVLVVVVVRYLDQ